MPRHRDFPAILEGRRGAKDGELIAESILSALRIDSEAPAATQGYVGIASSPRVLARLRSAIGGGRSMRVALTP